MADISMVKPGEEYKQPSPPDLSSLPPPKSEIGKKVHELLNQAQSLFKNNLQQQQQQQLQQQQLLQQQQQQGFPQQQQVYQNGGMTDNSAYYYHQQQQQQMQQQQQALQLQQADYNSFNRSTEGFPRSVLDRATAAKLRLENYYKTALDQAFERNQR